MSDQRDSDLLTHIENEFGLRLPVEYRAGLAADGRVIIPGPQLGEDVWLFSMAELFDINRLPTCLIGFQA